MNNKKFQWENEKIKAFIDDIGTKFIRGPFEYNGIFYDWKFIYKGEIDYCNNQQLIDWNVKVIKVVN